MSDLYVVPRNLCNSGGGLKYSFLYDYCSSCDCGWQNVSNTKFLGMPDTIYSKYGYRIEPLKLSEKVSEGKDYDDEPYPSLVPYYGEVGRRAYYRYKDRGTNKDERNYYKIAGEDSNINPAEYTLRGVKRDNLVSSKTDSKPVHKGGCRSCGDV